MPTPTKQLTTKTPLITGASRGIGAAIAERFAAEGANVIPNQNTGRVVASGNYLKETDRPVKTLDAAQLWDGRIAGLDF